MLGLPTARLLLPASSALPQIEGYAAAEGVGGTAFLDVIGVNPEDLTQNIIIGCCWYLGLALLAFLLLYLVMPRPRRPQRAAAPAG